MEEAPKKDAPQKETVIPFTYEEKCFYFDYVPAWSVFYLDGSCFG